MHSKTECNAPCRRVDFTGGAPEASRLCITARNLFAGGALECVAHRFRYSVKKSPQQPPTNTSPKYATSPWARSTVYSPWASACRSQHRIEINGKPWEAYPGQTVAAALVAAGVRTFRHTPNDAPRGLFCGMGVCYECTVTINGVPDQRACMTLVAPGMKIETSPNDKHQD
ncbi:MAG: Hydrogen cyanide synthase subunit HcnA [Chloroflexi bacterium]|nr:Hydrogen cyanide synthase subunit HcnA [Chloroflexota bacterium]